MKHAVMLGLLLALGIPDIEQERRMVVRSARERMAETHGGVVGGLFAINSGAIEDGQRDKVFYFGPNSLSWQPTNMDFQQFLGFCCSGNIAQFYDGFRWKTWKSDVAKLSTCEVITCYPLLWT